MSSPTTLREKHLAITSAARQQLAAGGHDPNAPEPYTAGTAVGITAVHGHLLAKIEMLTERISELEAAPVRYEGAWKSGQVYKRNALVTRAGGMWCARCDNAFTPGENNEAWQLCVKKGTFRDVA